MKIFPQLFAYFPDLTDCAYFEPFVGSGAVFSQITGPRRYFLSDANAELINTYNVIKNNPDALIESLTIFKKAHSPEFFKTVRALEPSDEVLSAARFIYLNKTCFNGLYRVNKRGKFNVPIGSYKNPGVVDTDNIMEWHTFLNSSSEINIECHDFTAMFNYFQFIPVIWPDSFFCYCDPPYDKVFSSYTAEGFTQKDQIDLKETLERCHARHPKFKFMVSNSATPFILDLYKDYLIDVISTTKSVKGGVPQAFDEVVIRNYE